jgi:hypothetical protein
MRRAWCGLLLAALGWVASGAASAATISIQVMDAAGVGFNDPTPFTPIGGNNATTLGQARLNVFTEAARLWGQLINSTQVIVVEASFSPLTCSANTGVLGSAGPMWLFRDFPGAPIQNVFYPGALADALSGANQGGKHAISAQFNSKVNGDSTCLGGSYFYYGHNDGRSYIADLLGVVLHELGHGLGFVSIVDQNGAGVTDSSNQQVYLGVFEQFTYEEALNMYWPALTAAQRVQSATGQVPGGNSALVWNGTHVNANLGRLSAGTSTAGHLKLYAPATFDASSSVSHWDSSATPDLLMEPRYSSTTGNHTDLTTCALYDMGWTGSRCPDGVNATATSVNVTADTATTITMMASDGDADVLTYAIVAQPTHGTLGVVNGAQVVYTPNTGYTGADQFSFKASDALVGSNTAVVSITVAAATSGGGGSGSGGSTGAATSGGGGGGAFDWPSLCALGLCSLVRSGRVRRRAQAAVASRPAGAS